MICIRTRDFIILTMKTCKTHKKLYNTYRVFIILYNIGIHIDEFEIGRKYQYIQQLILL